MAEPSSQQLIARIEVAKPGFNDAVTKVKSLSDALDGKSSSLRIKKVHAAMRRADEVADAIIEDVHEILQRRHWD